MYTTTRSRAFVHAASSSGDGGTRPARGRDARPSGSDGGGSNAATEERLDEILNAITTQNKRLEALEQGRRAALPSQPAAAAKTVTGTFDDAHLAELSAEDRALINELKNARPAEGLPSSAPVAAPETDSAPALPVNKMLMRATLALEQVAGRNTAPLSQPSHSTVPKFKLTGAQGRVQQDALNKAFNEDPAAVVREFEAAVASLAALDPSEQLTGHIIQETWRNNVPAREHVQIVREELQMVKFWKCSEQHSCNILAAKASMTCDECGATIYKKEGYLHCVTCEPTRIACYNCMRQFHGAGPPPPGEFFDDGPEPNANALPPAAAAGGTLTNCRSRESKKDCSSKYEALVDSWPSAEPSPSTSPVCVKKTAGGRPWATIRIGSGRCPSSGARCPRSSARSRSRSSLRATL